MHTLQSAVCICWSLALILTQFYKIYFFCILNTLFPLLTASSKFYVLDNSSGTTVLTSFILENN
jgi:hypothetical protein